MQHSATLSGAAHTPEVALARGLRATLRFSPRTACAVLLVCAGYYVGSQIGFILRLPPTTPSVLWPPNAILTAALLLTSPRRWGLYLLAALPAHLLAQCGTSWPMSMVLALFLTNCSEALMGARRRPEPERRDRPASTRLRRAVAFIVGAVVARARSSRRSWTRPSSPGLGGEAYWEVWRPASPPTCSRSWRSCPPSSPWCRQRTDGSAPPRPAAGGKRPCSCSRCWSWRHVVFTASAVERPSRAAHRRRSPSCFRCWSGPPSGSVPAAPAWPC